MSEYSTPYARDDVVNVERAHDESLTDCGYKPAALMRNKSLIIGALICWTVPLLLILSEFLF